MAERSKDRRPPKSGGSRPQRSGSAGGRGSSSRGSGGKPGGKPPGRGDSKPGQDRPRQERTQPGGRGRPSDTGRSQPGERRISQAEREADGTIPGRKDWGGLARRGASKVRDYHDEGLEEGPSPEERARFKERQAKRDKEEARREALRAEARKAVDRVTAGKSKKPVKKRAQRPKDRVVLPGRPRHVEDERTMIPRLLGENDGKRALRKLDQAIKAFRAERYRDALKPLSNLVAIVPEVPVVHELLGLSLYRLGKWRDAAAELEVFREQVGSTEQNPVLADCYRAMGRFADVEVLWTELAEASPSGELVVEGRIVAAGALADKGQLGSAVALLGKGWRQPKRPMPHHLRRAYALADLYERSGDLPRARALFAWLAGHDPDFVDIQERLRNLR